MSGMHSGGAEWKLQEMEIIHLFRLLLSLHFYGTI